MALCIILAVTGLLGLYMSWTIGANDVANSMGCAVGSNSLTPRQAVIAAGICEFAGAVLVGAHVTDTVRKGIVDPCAIASLPGLAEGEAATILIIGMGSALLSAAIWLNIATLWGLPVSTTHSIVGAVAGFGVVAAGASAVHWGKLGQIVASWFISPVVGGVLGYMIFKGITRTMLGTDTPVRSAIKYSPIIVFAMTSIVVLSIVYKGLKHIIAERADWLSGPNSIIIAGGLGLIAAIASRVLTDWRLRDKVDLPLTEQLAVVEKVFVPLVIISSCSVAFSHGANDVANAVGPLASVMDMACTGAVKMKVSVPSGVLVLGGVGIVLGLATYGYRVMRTIGCDIAEITPSRGVAANLAATATVLVCTRMKLPVSTTHTLVGAVLGMGFARGLTGINRKVTANIFGAWLITVPAAAVMSIVLFLLGRAFCYDLIHNAIP